MSHISHVNDVSPQYLAGFFDGEGCVRASKRTDKMYACGVPYTDFRLNVQTTVKHEPKMYYDYFEVGSLSEIERGPEHHRTQYRWVAGGEEALGAAKEMLPHIRNKYEQLNLFIEAVQLVGNRGKRIPKETAKRRVVLVDEIQSRTL